MSVSVLQKEEEGARHVAGFELPAPLLLLIESYLRYALGVAKRLRR